jgi:hypothetical protein
MSAVIDKSLAFFFGAYFIGTIIGPSEIVLAEVPSHTTGKMFH